MNQRDLEPVVPTIVEAAFALMAEGVIHTEKALASRFPGRTDEIHAALKSVDGYHKRIERERGGKGARAPGGNLAIGSTVGEFTIIGTLGRGSMGVVYRATQSSLGDREVALKVLNADLVARDPRFVERFRREATLASDVHHPNVAEVYGSGTDEGIVHFAMRLVEGRTLASVLRGLVIGGRSGEGTQSGPEYIHCVVKVVRDVALALAAVHDRGLVHRDVKPSNIILEDAGKDDYEALMSRPVLIDFGLIRPIESTDLTGSRSLMGTKPYASHEAQLGRMVGASTDVFSLGVTLHDLLTLTLPTRRGPATAALPDPRLQNPAVDERLAAISRMTTEEKPSLRYEDGGVLAEELDRYLNNQPVRALAGGRLGRFRLWAVRNPVSAVKTSVVATALLAGVLVVGWAAQRIIPLYSGSSRARNLEDRGDLFGAAEYYKQLVASRSLAGWLPGLGGALDRADTYWAEGGLAQTLSMVESSADSDLSKAGIDLQRRLLSFGAERDPARIMGFLAHELTQSTSPARRLSAVITAGQYLLVCPLPYDTDGAGEAWTVSLIDELARIVDAEDHESEMTELRYHAICALSGMTRVKVFRSLIPMIGHPDPEARRLAASATFRLWLLINTPEDGGRLPVSLLGEWCSRMWNAACQYDTDVHEASKKGRALEREYLVPHAGFIGKVGQSLDWVAWTLKGRRDGDLEIAWDGLPPGLVRHVATRARFLRCFHEAGSVPLSLNSSDLTHWPSTGAPLSDLGSFNQSVRNPEKVITAALQKVEDWTLHDNMWRPHGDLQHVEFVNQEVVAGTPFATFDFRGAVPDLGNGAVSAWGERLREVSAQGAGMEDESRKEGLHLVLRPGEGDSVHLVCRVPTWATGARVLVGGVTASRDPQPHRGSVTIVLTTPDDMCNLRVKASAAFDHDVPEFMLSRAVFRGKRELEMTLKMDSSTNLFWLHSVIVTFESSRWEERIVHWAAPRWLRIVRAAMPMQK